MRTRETITIVNSWPSDADMIRDSAAAYADTALECVVREYPHAPFLIAAEPGPYPQHRAVHPAFYGSFDWHSAVLMHWVLIRLLRVAPDVVPADTIRNVLDDHLSETNLRTEAAFFRDDPARVRERPYGWGWLLTVAHELDIWDDEGARWAGAVAPLADVLTDNLLDWLPRQAFPIRGGLHTNTAFGLLRSHDHALDRAGAGDDRLLRAIEDAVRRWYLEDVEYPAHYEPSGSDFLSPALAEAELVSRVLPPRAFAPWFDAFLPLTRDAAPRRLFEPVTAWDATDGQGAHLAGLNLSRAWSMRSIAAVLDRVPAGGDDGIAETSAALHASARRHADAGLPHVVGGDYMVEHWLAAYALGYLTT